MFKWENNMQLTRHKPMSSSPYDDEAYLACWWQYLAHNYDILCRRGPFMLMNRKVLKGLTCRKVTMTGWNNSAITQAFTPEKALQLTRFISGFKWDYIRINCFLTDQEREAMRILNDYGLEVITCPIEPEYVIDTTLPWEAYLKTRTRSTRSNIRRKMTKVEACKPRFETFSGEDAIDDFFKVFFRHHIPYWDQKIGYSYLNDPLEREFIVAWARMLHRKGQLLLNSLYINDELASLGMDVLHGDSMYGILTIVTGVYPELFPGQVGCFYEVQHAHELGLQRYWLSPGKEFYKTQLVSQTIPRYCLIIPNGHSWKGQFYSRYLQNKLAQFYKENELDAGTTN